MNSLASIMVLAVAVWQSIPHTNYVFTAPPPTNRIFGYVLSPTNSYKCVRAEDYAYIYEMAAERQFIANPYNNSDYTDLRYATISNECGLSLQTSGAAASFPNLLFSCAGAASEVLSNHSPDYCWYKDMGNQSIDFPTSLGGWGGWSGVGFTNFLNRCLDATPINIATGSVERWSGNAGRYVSLPAAKVSAVMSQLQGVKDYLLAASGGFAVWNIPAGMTNASQRCRIANQTTTTFSNKAWTYSVWATNNITQSGAHSTWSNNDGWGFTENNSKWIERAWYYDEENSKWEKVDTQVISDTSLDVQGATAPLIISAWQNQYITNNAGAFRVKTPIYGYMLVRFQTDYRTEYRESVYDEGDDSWTTTTMVSQPAQTNDYAVAVPLTLTFHSYGEDGYAKWASQGFSTIEVLFNELSLEPPNGFSPYGGSSTSTANLPQLQTPQAWTDENHRTTKASYQQIYRITLSHLDFYLIAQPNPKVEYKAGGNQ